MYVCARLDSQRRKFIFGRQRARIVKNVVLKVYSFLLVPCQTALWNSLQVSARAHLFNLSAVAFVFAKAAVSSLSEAELRNKFDLASTLSKLSGAEKQLLERAETLKALRSDIQRNAATFSM